MSQHDNDPDLDASGKAAMKAERQRHCDHQAGNKIRGYGYCR